MDFLTIGLLKAIVTGKNKNGTGPYHGSLNKSPIKTYHSSPVPRAAPVGNIQNFCLWMVIMLPFSHCFVVCKLSLMIIYVFLLER